MENFSLHRILSITLLLSIFLIEPIECKRNRYSSKKGDTSNLPATPTQYILSTSIIALSDTVLQNLNNSL